MKGVVGFMDISSECSVGIGSCLFEKDVSKVGFVYVNGVEKRCSSGLVFCLLPDLDVVIHYTPWFPRLVISLKFDKNRRFCLVDVPFYYSKAVLPVCYDDFLDFSFGDLVDE